MRNSEFYSLHWNIGYKSDCNESRRFGVDVRVKMRVMTEFPCQRKEGYVLNIDRWCFGTTASLQSRSNWTMTESMSGRERHCLKHEHLAMEQRGSREQSSNFFLFIHVCACLYNNFFSCIPRGPRTSNTCYIHKQRIVSAMYGFSLKPMVAALSLFCRTRSREARNGCSKIFPNISTNSALSSFFSFCHKSCFNNPWSFFESLYVSCCHIFFCPWGFRAKKILIVH